MGKLAWMALSSASSWPGRVLNNTTGLIILLHIPYTKLLKGLNHCKYGIALSSSTYSPYLHKQGNSQRGSCAPFGKLTTKSWGRKELNPYGPVTVPTRGRSAKIKISYNVPLATRGNRQLMANDGKVAPMPGKHVYQSFYLIFVAWYWIVGYLFSNFSVATPSGLDRPALLNVAP
jgi:hypothetical protein